MGLRFESFLGLGIQELSNIGLWVLLKDTDRRAEGRAGRKTDERLDGATNWRVGRLLTRRRTNPLHCTLFDWSNSLQYETKIRAGPVLTRTF